MPTHRGGAGSEQDHIRLKNLLRDARVRLGSAGHEERLVRHVLDSASALVEDAAFWQRQRSGLAVFVSPGWTRTFRVSIDLDELVVVGDRFHIKPVLPLLTRGGRFFVLALSQNRVRLHEATRFHIEEIVSDDIPDGLTDAVGYDWEERSLQFFTAAPGGGAAGRRQAVFHGHGAGKDDLDGEVARFLRLVDDQVRALVADHEAPLVVAAVDWLASAYRRISKYAGLVQDCIPGNPDETPDRKLHRRAWELVEPVIRAEEAAAATQVLELLGTSLASNDLEEIAIAAHDGRVDTAFVALGVQRWGRYDEQSRQIAEGTSGRHIGEDLLDLVAAQTLFHGGAVYAVHPADMPGGDSPIAAIFRYEMKGMDTGD
jgi:hypothetical protein